MRVNAPQTTLVDGIEAARPYTKENSYPLGIEPRLVPLPKVGRCKLVDPGLKAPGFKV